MPRTLGSVRHNALRAYIKGKRARAGLTQHQLAKRLGRSQSYVATIETGQRRIDAVELIDLGEALGFDAASAIRQIEKKKN
jgi:transcriptional regulator with XRE-family HTH domain